jgi:hypothetical protein
MPADGTFAVKKKQDFGTSRWQLADFNIRVRLIHGFSGHRKGMLNV